MITTGVLYRAHTLCVLSTIIECASTAISGFYHNNVYSYYCVVVDVTLVSTWHLLSP